MNIGYIVAAIGILSVIVTAHELGHFIVGRLCGIGVDEFSVGFGPKLLQRRGKKTLYSLRLLPLGGYCRFTGEDAEDDAPDAFNNQPVWKRFVTTLAGATMNFVLGYVLTVVIVLGFGLPTLLPQVDSFSPDMPAEAAGLMVGDKIESVDGEPIEFSLDGYYAMSAALNAHDLDRPVRIGVERGGEHLVYEFGLRKMEDGSHRIGIVLARERVRPGPGEGLIYSGQRIAYVMGSMVEMLRDLVFKGEGLGDVSGPVGIIGYVSEQMQEGVDVVLDLVILISLNLGIMNLLPLPALDGGRLVFLLVEGIRRKPVSRDKEGMVHLIGLGALLLLILAVTYRDIVRLVVG